jgi:hypothetical protein
VDDKIYTGQYKPNVTCQQSLWNVKKLFTIWFKPPPNDYLHIFNDLPIKLSPIVQQASNASTCDLWPMITLHMTLQGNFERLETIGKNKISELHGAELDFRAEHHTIYGIWPYVHMVIHSVAAAKAEFFSISCNKLCKIMKIIM